MRSEGPAPNEWSWATDAVIHYVFPGTPYTDGDKVQGVFITVDPERDKPELLKPYLESFDPSFIGLRGTPEQLKDVAKEFKIYYAKVPGKTPDSYTMDHTAASFLFDPQGRIRVFSRYGSGATALMSDIKALIAGQ